jgi:uncharacterized protein involved in exopolysaccharide biosynthesis/Mrp family chromosome partitioning ATPase
MGFMSGVQNLGPDVDVDLRALFAGLAANWRRNVAIAAIATVLALSAASFVAPRYHAESRVLIETGESTYTRPDNAADERPILDVEGVASQVELIASADLLKKVAAELRLAEHPEFDPSAGESAIGRMMALVGLKGDPVPTSPEERVLAAMRERLDVYKVENSRVIVVGFSSTDPELAAAVPRAITSAYVAMQREAKHQSTSAATDWLEQEIEDLRERVKAAEGKVAAFRGKSDLLIGQDNAPLATQQLSELSSELSRVSAARASAEAKAVAVERILESGLSTSSLPDVISSPLVQRLRERQAELQAELADLETTLLGNHPRIRSLRSQLSGLSAQIDVEARRILQGLKAEAETARIREGELTALLNVLKAQSARAGEQQVELRALEREATAQRELLESYLTRHREASARRDRNYLPADARVFEEAVVPTEPYFPKLVPIGLAAFAGTLLVLVIVTLMRELFSGRAMREAHAPQAAEPVMTEARAISGVEESPLSESPSPIEVPDTVAVPPAVARHDGSLGIEAIADHLISTGAARAVFVSPEGDEAAAASVLVAREIADAGLRVLLLDLTGTGAASRPMLDGLKLPGITDLLASQAQFTDIIHSDRYSECDVIPVGTSDPARAMRAVERLPIILDSLTTAYDLVVVECGPTDAAGVRRLVAPGAEVLVSVIGAGAPEVEAAAADLRSGGYEKLLLVSPAGYLPPAPPAGDRSAA